MEAWKMATLHEKVCILKESKTRLWVKFGIVLLVVCLLGAFSLYLVKSEYNTELNSIMKNDLGYDPNNPPVEFVILDLNNPYSLYEDTQIAKQQRQKEIDEEIAAARIKAEQEIGNKYAVKALYISLFLLIPSLSLCIFFYLKYRKGFQKDYAVANAVCVEKEKVLSRYSRYYSISVRLNDGSEIEDIHIRENLYDQINHKSLLVVAAPFEIPDSSGGKRNIDMEKIYVFLADDLAVDARRQI